MVFLQRETGGTPTQIDAQDVVPVPHFKTWAAAVKIISSDTVFVYKFRLVHHPAATVLLLEPWGFLDSRVVSDRIFNLLVPLRSDVWVLKRRVAMPAPEAAVLRAWISYLEGAR